MNIQLSVYFTFLLLSIYISMIEIINNYNVIRISPYNFKEYFFRKL